MLILFYFSSLFFAAIRADSLMYCANVEPQKHVDIQQIMGMWYGVEIINHKSEEEIAMEEYNEPACPVLHFYEDKVDISTTLSPLQRNYNGHRYAGDYGYNYGQESTTWHPYFDNSFQVYDPQKEHLDEIKRRFDEQIKRIKIIWDQNNVLTEYLVRYNVSRAGFWISSGPNNGSAVIPMLNSFAGTIQVLKAVGSHMVLVFCQQVPDRQLFSILLSRTPSLSLQEIHGVHNLLGRRRLNISHVKKVCQVNSSEKLYVSVSIVSFFIIFTALL